MLTTQQQPVKTHTRLKDFYPTPEVRRETEGYRSWLVQQSRREEKREDRVAYSRAALTPLALDGKRIFAPWNEQQSAYKILTLPQTLFLVVLFLGALGAGYFLRLEALTIALGLVTTLYLVQLVIHACVVVRELAQEETSGGIDQQRVLDNLRTSPWPTYTILCPLYKEAAVVPQFIKAMRALDYPTDRLQILFLTEEEDSATRAAIHDQGHLPACFRVMIVPQGEPRTKPRACNYGLLHTTGRYVVIFDAEDIPEPTQLKKAVLAFADGGPRLACVQAQLSFYNQTQNILTRLFSIEYLTWFALTLPALARAGFALPLGGTSNHFQASVLRALGGWDAYNVTEDCDLGMRVHQYGFKTGMLASTTFEEATSQVGNWIRQRSRWIKGFMQTYLVHTRHPIQALTKGRGHTLLSLQTIIGGSFVVFINPLMWLLLIVYIAFRGQVEGVYQVLFPAPVLYGGALCLIFGNFFYVYIAMLICAKREQYNLVPWCFLLLLYWLLMSVAAAKALFQLITRPHYWEKTRHGLHLGTGSQVDLVEAVRVATGHIADEETQLLPSTSGTILPFSGVSTTTERVRAIETLPVKSVSNTAKRTTRVKVRDFGAWAIGIVATVCSITATIYYYNAHELLLYGDAYSHIRIARGLFDNLTPGIAQFGGVWLPFQHLMMQPFIWNNYLWQTGLAGSIPSMICYIAAALYLFCTLYRLTKQSLVSLIGVTIFLSNPNILYLQSTPLTEVMCATAFAATTYYMLRWIQEGKLLWLVCTAIATFAATLTRYDGWALFLVICVLVIMVGVLRKQPWKFTLAHFLLYTSLGALGIILWLIWCKMIFGDPLYFQRGPYSAQAQQLDFLHRGALPTYHNLIVSLRVYIIDSGQSIGWGLLICAVISIPIALFVYHKREQYLILAIMLVPFVFYVATLYTGQSIIYLPGAGFTTFFNARYGSQMALPVAFLITLGLTPLYHWLKKQSLKVALITVCLIGLTGQIYQINISGILSVQDGLIGVSCTPLVLPVDLYLIQHYNSGKILVYEYGSQVSNPQDFGANFSDIVYEGSGDYWHNALSHPEQIVDWVILKGNSSDFVAQHVKWNSQVFLSQFNLVAQDPNGLQLYHKVGLSNSFTRSIPNNILKRPRDCIDHKLGNK